MNTTSDTAPDRTNIRALLSAEARNLAQLQYNTPAPSQEQIKQALNDATGIATLTDITARGSYEERVDALGKLRNAIAARTPAPIAGAVAAAAAMVATPAPSSMPPAPAPMVQAAAQPGSDPAAQLASLLQQMKGNGEDAEARASIRQIQSILDAQDIRMDMINAAVDAVDPQEIDKLKQASAAQVLVNAQFDNRIHEHEQKLSQVDALLAAVNGAGNNRQLQARVSLAMASQSNPVIAEIAEYYAPGAESSAIVALCSPPSFGKSFAVRCVGAAYDVFLEHGCSPDPEEINLIVGSPTVRQDGTVLVVDGVLTQAVRAASSGAKVLLFLDEVFRWAPRTQEKFLTFVTGVKKNGKLWYRLPTRAVEASTDNLEVLECEACNLHIITAGNLNRPMEDAFASRFELIRMEYSQAFAAVVAQSILDSYGITPSTAGHPQLASVFAKVMTQARELAANQTLQYPLNFRMLERAALISDGTETGVAARLTKRLADNLCAWDHTTGDMLPASYEAAGKLAEKFAGI
jgi:MoxR-like ATPase